MKEKILNAIFRSIEELNESSDKGLLTINGDETKLFGRDGELDSLGLINLIVLVEQNIEEDFDIIITLADEKAISQKRSPFRNVGTLKNYIFSLINQGFNEQ
tara:strand:+ start:39 stop:344 length:306 start_codon:yes stop_codon:yes gene_type:complete